MANSQHSASISRCINAVLKRVNDSALVRRPLSRYRPAVLSINRNRIRAIYGEESEDEYDFQDDSPDYRPSSPETDEPPAKRRKREPLGVQNRGNSPKHRSAANEKTKVKSPKRKSPRTVISAQSSHIQPHQELWERRVPVEVLHCIFQRAMCNEATIPFLTKMQRVCRLWRDAARSPHLWTVIDLEYLKGRKPRVIFASLTKYAPVVRELSVSRWDKLTVSEIEDFLVAAKELRTLNVSLCRALDLRRLLCTVIPQYCPKLNSLDLSYIDPTGHKKVTAILREYLSLECGRQLQSLFLNGNCLADLRRLCAESARSKATENVRVLHLSRVCMSSGQSSHKIRLVDFINAFPNLRVLHMADAMLEFTCTAEEENTLGDGWPYLYDCNIAATSDWHRYNEVYGVFIKLLGHCKNLCRLNLAGLNVYDRLIWLRETPLTYLNLSRVRNLAKNAVTVDFFSTWGRSLESLSMAWVVGYVDSLCALFVEAKKRGFAPRLKRLDLTGTCVTALQLKVLLDVCQSLEFVDVQSCRGMPLGMKRAYEGANDMAALRSKLENEN